MKGGALMSGAMKGGALMSAAMKGGALKSGGRHRAVSARCWAGKLGTGVKKGRLSRYARTRAVVLVLST